MPKINQSGFAPILIIAMILIIGMAIVIGVNLTGEKQDLTSSAAQALIQDGEFGSTPINEILKMRRPANGIKLWPGQMHFSYNPLLLEFIATHYEYVHLDSTNKQAINFLHARNPNIKIIAAVGGAATMIPHYEPYKYLIESDFLHLKSNPSQRVVVQSNDVLNIGSDTARRNLVTALNRILSETPGIDGLLFDGYHPYADWLTEECLEAPDCNKQKWYSPSTRESDFWYSGYRAYNQLARSLIIKDKELFFNGFNPSWGPEGDVGTAYTGWANDFDGAYIEHFEYAYIKPEYFNKSMKALQEMVNQGKTILFNGEPGLLLGTNNGVIPPITADLQRFFLAAFLLINNNQNTYYGFVPGEPDPTKISNVYFYKDWYLDFGAPVDIYRNSSSPNIYYRHYTNGLVVVNDSSTSQTFDFPPGYGKVQAWQEGEILEGSAAIPSKSGRFFFKTNLSAPVMSLISNTCIGAQPTITVGWSRYQPGRSYLVHRNNQPIISYPSYNFEHEDTGASNDTQYSYWVAAQGGPLGDASSNTLVVQSRNCTPTSSSSPSATPLPTPSPSIAPSASPGKPGDIDGNNKVDIFDYNILVTNFGKTGAAVPGDLDLNGRVDIFDYNIILGNFGK